MSGHFQGLTSSTALWALGLQSPSPPTHKTPLPLGPGPEPHHRGAWGSVAVMVSGAVPSMRGWGGGVVPEGYGPRSPVWCQRGWGEVQRSKGGLRVPLCAGPGSKEAETAP